MTILKIQLGRRGRPTVGDVFRALFPNGELLLIAKDEVIFKINPEKTYQSLYIDKNLWNKDFIEFQKEESENDQI